MICIESCSRIHQKSVLLISFQHTHPMLLLLPPPPPPPLYVILGSDAAKNDGVGNGDDADSNPNRRNTSNVVTKMEITIKMMHTHAWPIKSRLSYFTGHVGTRKHIITYSTSYYRLWSPIESPLNRGRLDTVHSTPGCAV